jgi:hypothetical protein
MAAVKDRRIGVWFSLALAILVLSAWLGSKLGARVAVYRYRSAQSRSLGTLSASEHAHLESVLDELEAIGFLRLTFLVSPNDDKLKKTLPEQLGKIDAYRRKVKTAEAKPVIDMNLALANVVAAIAEEQSNNKDRTANYVRSAQSLYQSLGWRDYSEETLRDMAQRKLDEWKLDQQSRGHAK